MDPLSHGILGAAYAAAFATKRKELRLAALCGLVAAWSPDLDILIRSAENPLLSVRYHRFFTHSVLLAPLLSLPVAAFLWCFLRRHMAFASIYLLATLGMMTHGMLDSMTNYGTHLFWPLTMRRESWSVISIIDPIFTLTLLGCLLVGVIKHSKIPILAGLCFAALYFGYGYMQREAATREMLAIAAERGHQPARFEVKPSFANLFVWRAQYAHQGRAYMEAIHLSPWAGVKHYGSNSVALYQPHAVISPRQQRDLEYFTFFSDGWVAARSDNPNEIGDVRFALLPYHTEPLWAIRLKPAAAPDAHVDFVSTRQRKEGDFLKLWHMIQGVDLKKSEAE